MVLVDGIDFYGDVDGIEDLKITYERNTRTQTVEYATSSTLTFYGDAYRYLEDKFFSDRTGCTKESTVSFEADCCGGELRFLIKADGLNYCPGQCKIEAKIIQDNPDTKAYDCLNNKVFWKDTGFIGSETHPKVYYCNDFTMIGAVLTIARIILWVIDQVFCTINTIIDIFVAIIGVIPFLRDAIEAVTGINLDDVEIPLFSSSLDPSITGCNNEYHPSPLILSIMNFTCGYCGLEFESSILNSDPYNRMVLLQAQFEEGADEPGINWIEENAANLTLIQLLELLKPVFNADYRIKNGKLIFERVDYFDRTDGILVDLTETQIEEEDYCFSFISEQRCAFMRGAYAYDSVDFSSTFVADCYNDIIEWNPEPLNPNQKGECTVQAQFSPARFMRDKKRTRFLFDIDRLRESIENDDGERTNFNRLLLTGGKSQEYKLIILEGNFVRDDARPLHYLREISTTRVISVLSQACGSAFGIVGAIIRLGIQFVSPEEIVVFTYDYNTPLWFEESREDGLYKNFHFVNNPRREEAKKFIIDNYEYAPFDFCAAVSQIVNNPCALDLGVISQFGTGKSEKIEIDFSKKTIKITNVKF